MIHKEVFTVNGRAASVSTLALGRYGDKWREIEVRDATHFAHSGNSKFYGLPILPPQEWKVLCWVERVAPPTKPRPVLRLVA